MATTFERNEKNEETKHPVLLEESVPNHLHGWQIPIGIGVTFVAVLLFVFVVRYARKRDFKDAVKPHEDLARAMFAGGGTVVSAVSNTPSSGLTHLSQM